MNRFKLVLFVLFFCLQSGFALYAQSNALSAYGNIGIGTLTPDSLANYRIIDARGTAGDFGGIFQSVGFNGSTKTRLYSAAGVGYLGTVTNHPFSIFTNGVERITFTNNGKVGIGTGSPNQKLEVAGNAVIAQYGYTPSDRAGSSALQIIGSNIEGDNSATVSLEHVHGGRNYPFGMAVTAVSNFTAALTFFTSTYTGSVSTTERMRITNDGKIGIGTISPSEKLSVNGNISAKKIIVTQSGWSDYVFDSDYKLRTLSSLETFIKQNKHLPEVLSAKEVEENGISVGDNQALLLKKIEELTMYVIALKKENEKQQKDINKLKGRVK
jgi:hypothetical protein